jgi:hypothetical protein
LRQRKSERISRARPDHLGASSEPVLTFCASVTPMRVLALWRWQKKRPSPPFCKYEYDRGLIDIRIRPD